MAGSVNPGNISPRRTTSAIVMELEPVTISPPGSTCAWPWREQQRGRLGRRANSEPDPHPGGAVSGHAAEDQVVPRQLRVEAHHVRRFRRKSLREPEREGTRNGGISGLRRQRRLRRDHLGAMRQHPVMVTEVDLRLPPDGPTSVRSPSRNPLKFRAPFSPVSPAINWKRTVLAAVSKLSQVGSTRCCWALAE